MIYRRREGFRGRLNQALLHRTTVYLLFIAIMMFKLVLLHYSLNITTIDMNPVDYIVAFGSLLLVSFWTLWLPPRGRLFALTLLNLLLTGIIYSDLVFYRYFEDFITVPVLMQAGQVGSLGDSILSLIEWQDLFFFLDWILLVPWTAALILRRKRMDRPELNWSYRSSAMKRSQKLRRLTAGALALVLGILLTYVPIKAQSKTWAVGLFEGNWWNVSLYNVTGLLGFHGYDAYRYVRDHSGLKPSLPDTEIAESKDWFEDLKKTRSGSSEWYGKYKGSNIIMIQTEALMNFVVGKSLNGQEITPNFNALMEESLYFSSFYHQTALGRTSDADFVTQSSLLPLPMGSVFTRYPSHMYDTLPSILKQNHYAANVYHSYDSSFWNRQTVYREMNYDNFYSKKDFEQDEMIGWSVSDASFFKQSLDKMQELPEPFYSFLITLSSHHPYSMPKKEKVLDTGAFEGSIFGNYLHSIHYFDKSLGQLVDQMKKQGLWDNTILIVYGDHDNSIKEKAYYEEFLGRQLSDLEMEQIMNQVPLLIHLPDQALTGVDSEPAGMFNIAPTLYDLLGIPTDSYYLLGDSLLSERERLVPLRSGAFSAAEYMYLPGTTAGFEGGTCYSLESGNPLELDMCRTDYEASQNMLRISDQIVTYDLLRKFRASDK